MSKIRLGCARAGTLFYEPDGLLLRTCLIPKDDRHLEHLLTFQLGYLGAGEIMVHVALEGGSVPSEGAAISGESVVTAVLLQGASPADIDGELIRPLNPGVWLTYGPVSDTRVHYRYTVWGQSAPGSNDLRGMLITDVEGVVPLLVATTRVSVTRLPLSGTEQVNSMLEWDDLADAEEGLPLRCHVAAASS